MADASYVIDLILRARDDTAAAFASALGNQERFNQELQKSDTQAAKNAETFRRTSAKIAQSNAELEKQLKAINAESVEVAKAQQGIERATKARAQTEASAASSQADKALALARVKAAETAYAKAVAETIRQERERVFKTKAFQKQYTAEVEAALGKQQVAHARLEEAKSRNNKRDLERATKASKVADTEVERLARIKKATETVSDADVNANKLRASSLASSSFRLSQGKEQIAVLDKLRVSTEKYIGAQKSDDAAKFNKQIDEQTAALVRLGRAQAEADEFRAGATQARKDAQFAREREQAAQEEAAALIELEKFTGTEVEKSRRATEARLKRLDAEEATDRAERRKQDAADAKANAEARADFEKFVANEIAKSQKEIDAAITAGEKKDAQERAANQRKELALHRAANDARREEARQRKEIVSATKDYTREIDRAAAAQANLDQANKVGGAAKDAIPSLRREVQLRKQAAELAAARLRGTIRDDVVINVDLDTGEAVTQAALFEAIKLELGRDIHVNVDLDVGGALAGAAAMSALKGATDGADKSFKDALNGISTVDNVLRGFVTIGIILFVNQLAVGVTALAGAFVALAGAAIYAGGALAGALVAGIAQAVPVLGVLGAAAQRFTKVIEAVKQQQLVDEQEAGKQSKIAKGVADAQDRITSSSESLIAAQERQRDAQIGVNDARVKAARALQDLILQERAAELAAKGAVLSQEEAQKALQRAVREGDTGAIQRAQLDVESSKLGVTQSRLGLGRTREDLANRRTGEAPEVKAAKDAAKAAGLAVTQAERALKAAQRAAKETGDEALAAAGKLDFLLGKLSASERRLFENVNKLFNFFDGDAISNITDPVIDAINHVLEGAFKAFENPAFLNSITNLSTVLGKSITRFFDHFASGDNAQKLLQFIDDAAQNLVPFTDIFINLGDAFITVAIAAAPILHRMFQDLAKLTRKMADFLETPKGQHELQKFFETGYKALKSFGSLLKATGSLILAVIDPDIGGGATTGIEIIEGLTNGIKRLDDAARSDKGRSAIRDFFKYTKEVLKATVPLLASVARAIAGLFTESGVANFKAGVKIFTEVFIPAIEKILVIIGFLNRVFAWFLEIPFASTILSWVLALSAVYLVMGRLGRLLLAVGGNFGKFIGGIGLVIRTIRNWRVELRLLGNYIASLGLGSLWAAFMTRIRAARVALNNLGNSGGVLGKLRGAIGRIGGTLVGKLGLVGAAGLAGFAIGKMLRDNIPLLGEFVDKLGEALADLLEIGEHSDEFKTTKKVSELAAGAGEEFAATTDPKKKAILKKIIDITAAMSTILGSGDIGIDEGLKLAALQAKLDGLTKQLGHVPKSKTAQPVAESSATTGGGGQGGDTVKQKRPSKDSKSPKIPGLSNIPDIGEITSQVDGLAPEVKKVLSAFAKSMLDLIEEGGPLDQIREEIEKFTATSLAKIKGNKFAFGKSGIVFQGGERGTITEEQVAQKEIEVLQKEFRKYRGSLKGIADNIKKVAARLKAAKTDDEREALESALNGLKKHKDELQSTMADLLEELAQKQLDKFQKGIEKALAATTSGGSTEKQIQAAKTVADALGQSGVSANLESALIDVMKKQAAILKKKIADAKRRGYTDLAAQLEQQLLELQTNIATTVVDQLKSAVDIAEKETAKRDAAVKRIQFAADLAQKASGITGGVTAATIQQAATQAQGSSLQQTLSDLQVLLKQAQAQGNVGVASDLTEKIADLQQAIQENTIAQQDAAVAIVQANVDMISASRDFTTGTVGGIKGLFDAVAINLGPQDPAVLAAALGASQEALSTALTKLEDQLLTFGIDLRGLSGASLATALTEALAPGGKFATIRAGLDEFALAKFDALISNIIGNATALEESTAAINSLNSSISQTFQSSAWQQFRQALFDGSGGVMPTYSIPTFDTGGEVIRAGIAKVHPGDIAIKGSKPGQQVQGGWRGDVNIEVNEAGQNTDARHLAALFAFEMRTMGNRR